MTWNGHHHPMPTQACLLPLASDVELLALVESLSSSGGSSLGPPAVNLASQGLGVPARPTALAAAAPESPSVQLLRGFLVLQQEVKSVVALEQVRLSGATLKPP